MESFIKIYIFLKLDLLDINFLSSVVYFIQKLLERKRTKIQTNIELKIAKPKIPDALEG